MTGSPSRNGVHLVRSPSAHRFGYVEPALPTLRSRIGDIFDSPDGESDDENDFGLMLDSSAIAKAMSEARDFHRSDDRVISRDPDDCSTLPLPGESSLSRQLFSRETDIFRD